MVKGIKGFGNAIDEFNQLLKINKITETTVNGQGKDRLAGRNNHPIDLDLEENEGVMGFFRLHVSHWTWLQI